MSRFHTLSSALLIAIGLVWSSASAAAQVTEKQAEAQLRTNGKKAVAALRSALNERVAEMKTTIKNFDTATAGDVDLAPLIEQLVDDTHNVRVEILDDIDTFTLAYSGACFSALDAFEGSGDLKGQYPPAFRSGTGGLMDQLHASAQRLHDRALDVIERRLQKTARRLEKLHGHSLLITLPAMPIDPVIIGPGSAFIPTSVAVLSVFATSSDLGVGGDGIVHARGRVGFGEVTMSVLNENALLVGTETIDPPDAFFSFTFTELLEGNLAATLDPELLDSITVIQSIR